MPPRGIATLGGSLAIDLHPRRVCLLDCSQDAGEQLPGAGKSAEQSEA